MPDTFISVVAAFYISVAVLLYRDHSFSWITAFLGPSARIVGAAFWLPLLLLGLGRKALAR